MLNEGYKYNCDRCEVTQLRDDEYNNNWRLFFNPNGNNGSIHYCDECWNWIHLQKWTDEDGNKHTLRSERKITL